MCVVDDGPIEYTHCIHMIFDWEFFACSQLLLALTVKSEIHWKMVSNKGHLLTDHTWNVVPWHDIRFPTVKRMQPPPFAIPLCPTHDWSIGSQPCCSFKCTSSAPFFFSFLFHWKPTVEQTVKLMLGNKGSFCSHPSIPPINMSVLERKKELAKTVKMNSVSDLRC